LPANQIGHQCWQAIVLAFQPLVLDGHVLALDVAGFVETFAERGRKARGGIGRPVSNKPDHRQRRLLRTRRERLCGGCASDHRDELAPSHVRPEVQDMAS
jgi:hypothetical protein